MPFVIFVLFSRGKKVYEPPRYMSVNEAVKQLLDVIKTRDLKGESPGKGLVLNKLFYCMLNRISRF